MNTNHLKKFAQSARRKLLSQVAAKLDYVLTHDTAELREQATAIKKLKAELERVGKEQLVEKVSYIWFNRLMALRFMDANDYQPGGIRIVSARDGESLPEILQEAKQGGLTDPAWKSKMSIVNDILDGKLNSKNPQNEAYRHLLVGACNQLSRQFPFLFEMINDYAELLLPDDLTSEFSIVYDVVEGMSTEDCAEVEIIGWLYQFYISEKKDELINAKKKYKADEIAPVTQLFTPKWIVEYMVANTLGQLWKEARPNTSITKSLEFYIEPNNPESIPQRTLKSVEEITFFDPCMGSGHVLVYAFDIFYKMYEEEGYTSSQIPELILTNNIYGIDIDDRAAQLAGFALMMKGRQYNRRFLKKAIVPNVTSFQNVESNPKFRTAKVLGSLIKVNQSEVDNIDITSKSLFTTQNKQLQSQASLLAKKYDIVVTNPPYLNSSYMEDELKNYVNREYQLSKSDLFACFIIQSISICKENGLIGFICPSVWMFLKSYIDLRDEILESTTISSLIQLEYNAFGPAVVPIATFTLRNSHEQKYIASYIKLTDFKGIENQPIKCLEAIRNKNCNWFFRTDQNAFNFIEGKIIAYWSSPIILSHFKKTESLSSITKPLSGLVTGDDHRYIRKWFEVANIDIEFDASINSNSVFVPLIKGGSFRKWYGNNEHILKFYSEGNRYGLTNKDGYFKNNINWSEITSSTPSFRLVEDKYIFNKKGPSLIVSDLNKYELLGFLNSKVSVCFLKVLSQSISVNTSEVARLPILDLNGFANVKTLIEICHQNSTQEWNSREASWDFLQNELIKTKALDLQESIEFYQQYWTNKFYQLHSNEEELNKHFIEIYGLQEELTPDVPLSDITILRDELDQKKLKEINEQYQSGWILKNHKEWVLPSKVDKLQLPFDTKEIMAQFISYSVGCMMGRYSLDKEGLILANAGDSLEQYTEIVGKQITDLTFEPDDDAIIPVLDDEWFEDDIVGRFYAFLKASFGEKDFAKNLQFLEQQIGKDIRKYFVKDFYKDHIKRYKKRPIYWMFSSPKGHFRVLIYLHRYTPDTLNNILNDYLRDFIQKLEAQKQHYQQLQETGSASEQTKAIKEIDKLDKMILDCQEYERDILYPLATERLAIDLDDGVLVNYNKFGKAVEKVAGLNDEKTKKKVRGFDWIDVETIKD